MLSYFILLVEIEQIFQIIMPKKLTVNLFGSNNSYSIPLAAIFGLLVYISVNFALTLLNSFLSIAVSEIVLLTFIIKGQGKNWL